MARTTLITGGAGFIGSHLVESLLAMGDEVYVVDDLSNGQLEHVAGARGRPGFRLIVDSIMNWPMMNELVERVDRVFHLAAAEGVRRGMEEPVETITTNVRGTEIVLDVCDQHRVPVFLASTAEIYGKAGGDLHEERDAVTGIPPKRRWAYASTKSLDEFLGFAFHEERGLPVVVGRLFDVVGPRQRARWRMIFPGFVENALRGEPLVVYGDGSRERSFLHVADAVRAIEGLMETDAAVGDVFNIGHEGAGVTIRELAERVIARTGSTSTIRTVSYEEAYGKGFEPVDRRRPVAKKIRGLLDWAPEHDLDRIIDDVAASLQT